MSLHTSQPEIPNTPEEKIWENSRPAKALAGLPEMHIVNSEDSLEIWTRDCYALLFHIEGDSSKLIGEKGTPEFLSENEIVLLNTNTRTQIQTKEGSSTILCLYCQPSIHLCLGICPASGNGKECRRMKSFSNTSLLPRVPILNAWLDSTLRYMTECSSSEIFELKVRELFFIFRTFYDRATIDRFLSSFHCHNKGFRGFVFSHHLECRTVEELATKMNLSLSSFKRHFQQEFGCSPLKWMHEERAKHVYLDLTNPDLSLQEIADKQLFSSVSYLCAFSRKMFGNTPLQLRKEFSRKDPTKKKKATNKAQGQTK